MSIFGTKTVDQIMSRFTKTVDELTAHAAAQDLREQAAADAEMRATTAKMEARTEAKKARIAAKRLSDLFG